MSLKYHGLLFSDGRAFTINDEDAKQIRGAFSSFTSILLWTRTEIRFVNDPWGFGGTIDLKNKILNDDVIVKIELCDIQEAPSEAWGRVYVLSRSGNLLVLQSSKTNCLESCRLIQQDVSRMTTNSEGIFYTKAGQICLIPHSDLEVHIPQIADFDAFEICAGHSHLLALSADGTVYSMGSSGRFGELGHGEMLPCLKLTPILALEGIRMTQIACGGFHSAAISEFGDVYLWGRGQIGSSDSAALPSLAKLPESMEWTQVACGLNFTIVKNSQEEVWGVGDNRYGQVSKNPVVSVVDFEQMQSVADPKSQRVDIWANPSSWGCFLAQNVSSK